MEDTRDNQLCKVRPEYCDSEAEKDVVFEILADLGDRVDIAPVNWQYYIRPIQTVKTAMITPITLF
jgi:hypothetical protein